MFGGICLWSHLVLSSFQSLSHVWLFATPWIAVRQASLSITNSQSSLRLTSIESVMPSRILLKKDSWWIESSRWRRSEPQVLLPLKLQVLFFKTQSSCFPLLRKVFKVLQDPWLNTFFLCPANLLSNLWEFLQERKTRLKPQNPNELPSKYRTGKSKIN